SPRPRAVLLLLILACWLPTFRDFRKYEARSNTPYREIDGMIRQMQKPNDVMIVHSIPSGVLGIARYMPIEIPTASWVGQLKQRQVPQDVQTFVSGHDRVIFVKIHEVGAPAPEEDWLTEHGKIIFTTFR